MSEEFAGEIVLYLGEDGQPALEVNLDQDTVWLSQSQIAELFQTTKQNVSLHVANIFHEGELTRDRTVKESLTVRREGNRDVRRRIEYYNLDLIISVGYRIKSKTATQFRIWATNLLREYLQKGFAMDDDRLKNLGGGTYWRELLDRIRDIRSSEKVLYRQLLDLYATSVDYDPKAEETKQFFSIVQNKLHYAAHGRTAAEVVMTRADASEPNMGLTSFAGKAPRKTDVITAKNYLDEQELKSLNALVSAYFDAAEFRAQKHEPTYMKDWLVHLDRIIVAMDAPTLNGPGTVGHKQAVPHAEDEYVKYRAELDASPSEVERVYLESIKQVRDAIEGTEK